MNFLLPFLPKIIEIIKKTFSKGGVVEVAETVAGEVSETNNQVEVENAKSKWHQRAIFLAVIYICSIGWIGLYCGLRGGALLESYGQLMAVEEFKDLNLALMIFIGGAGILGIRNIFRKK